MPVAIRHRSRPKDSVRAVGLALLVHGTVLALLAMQFRSSPPLATPAPVIQARVVRATSQAPEPSAARQAAARKEAEARRKAEAKRQAEAERKAEAKRQAEAKRKAEDRRRAEAERQAEAKRKAEAKRQAEAKRKAETERQKRAQRQLQKQLAAEEAQRTRDAERARAMQEAAGFKSKIFARISRNWIVPPQVDRSLSCTVQVRLVPGGEVLSVTITSSSGDANFDRSVENAVYKSSPLPVPDDAAAFEQLRELELTFSPKDIQR